jgi:hypothetical protein
MLKQAKVSTRPVAKAAAYRKIEELMQDGYGHFSIQCYRTCYSVKWVDHDAVERELLFNWQDEESDGSYLRQAFNNET